MAIPVSYGTLTFRGIQRPFYITISRTENDLERDRSILFAFPGPCGFFFPFLFSILLFSPEVYPMMSNITKHITQILDPPGRLLGALRVADK
jgi:hypothetical protein